MGEESSQLEREILAERVELGQNLNELQSRVQQLTDWRVQFQKRPGVLLAAALGGGFLVAALTGRKGKAKRE